MPGTESGHTTYMIGSSLVVSKSTKNLLYFEPTSSVARYDVMMTTFTNLNMCGTHNRHLHSCVKTVVTLLVQTVTISTFRADKIKKKAVFSRLLWHRFQAGRDVNQQCNPVFAVPKYQRKIIAMCLSVRCCNRLDSCFG